MTHQGLFKQFIGCNNCMQSPALFQKIFKILCPFPPLFLPFFGKIACMPLLSRIGPAHKHTHTHTHTHTHYQRHTAHPGANLYLDHLLCAHNSYLYYSEIDNSLISKNTFPRCLFFLRIIPWKRSHIC